MEKFRKSVGFILSLAVVVGLLYGAAPGPLSIPQAEAAVTHPFLIVNAGDYAALSARTSSAPWSVWKTQAMSDATSLTVDSTDPIDNRATKTGAIASSAALAYILDTPNRAAYRQKIMDMITFFDTHIYPHLNGGLWENTVPPSGAFFNLVLALDIIYPDLTPAQRADLEGKLNRTGDWFYANRYGSWDEARMGAYGIWALYEQDRPRINLAKTDFKSRMLAEFTSDGVFLTGPGYANNRFAGDVIRRDAKSHFLDVLEHTGEDQYYLDSRMVNIHEWLFGYAATPISYTDGSGVTKRDVYTFGDSATKFNPLSQSAAIYRASRFGSAAERNAARTVKGSSLPDARLLVYVLADKALTASPTPVPSRIFPNGGAWLMENTASSEALTGALWNPKGAEWHSHKDVNAVHLTAYGEHVLRNTGYNGANASAAGFSWDYIQNKAVGNNTVLLDYNNFGNDYSPPATNDHAAKSGNGIVEGFTGGAVEYASGDSGNALPNGRHQRNFVFVPPQDGRGGYWILFDEVDATNGNVNAHIALHPNASTAPAATTANTEYTSTIGPHLRSSNNVKLTTFLATPPTSVQIRDGAMADWNSSFVGKYLYSTYATNGSGVKQMVTVLYPHDNTRSKAAMSRISGTGYTGASISLGAGIVDYAIESQGTAVLTSNGASFQGLAAAFRKNGSALGYYFVRKGQSFAYGGQGFASNANVSVQMRDKMGDIANSGGSSANVSFSYPGITGVLLNGIPQPILSYGAGSVQVSIPPGTFDVELRTTGTPALVYEMFNDAASGGSPAGWTVNAPSGTGLAISETPSAADKSVKLTDSSSASLASMEKSFAWQSGRTSIAMEFMLPGAMGFARLLQLRGNGTTAVEMYISTEGNIVYRDHTGADTVVQWSAPNTWYTIQVIADPVSDTYDIYVNNRLAKGKVSFRNAVSGFNSVFFGTGQAGTGIMYVDGVQVFGL